MWRRWWRRSSPSPGGGGPTFRRRRSPGSTGWRATVWPTSYAATGGAAGSSIGWATTRARTADRWSRAPTPGHRATGCTRHWPGSHRRTRKYCASRPGRNWASTRSPSPSAAAPAPRRCACTAPAMRLQSRDRPSAPRRGPRYRDALPRHPEGARPWLTNSTSCAAPTRYRPTTAASTTGPSTSTPSAASAALLHSGRPRRLRRWVLSVGTAAAVGVTALTLLLSGSATTPAVAAPRPLQIESGSTPVPLGRIAARAAADRSQRLRQGTHTQTWSLSMTAGPGARPHGHAARGTCDPLAGGRQPHGTRRGHRPPPSGRARHHRSRPRPAHRRGRSCAQQADLPAQLERCPASGHPAARHRAAARLPRRTRPHRTAGHVPTSRRGQ